MKFTIPYLFLFFLSCVHDKKNKNFNRNLTLYSTFKSSFPIGLGIHLTDILSDSSQLMSKHFASISTANAFKFEAIHPHFDEYDFKEAYSIVSFAQKYNLKLRGHTLVWGNRNPYWLFWDAKGNLVHRKLLDQRLKNHITTVIRRFKKAVHTWDVVNEAVYDNDKEWLKHNSWYKIMGENYILNAFRYAHEADSNAILFYNDYNAEFPDKRNRIVRLINIMKDNHVPIHGIGIQGHWTTDNLDLDDLEDAIDVYSSLGLSVQITELNIVDAEYPNAENPASLKKIAIIYQDLFKILLKHKHQITGVTFWQSESTKHKFFPLFDSLFKPTVVYHAIINAN